MPTITFLPNNRKVEAAAGTSLLDAASAAGVVINAPCGGEGACGQCRVRIEAGSVEAVSRGCLSEAELGAGWALACSSRVVGDLTVRVEEETDAAGAKIVIDRGASSGAIGFLHRGHAGEPVVLKFRLEVSQAALGDQLSDLERLSRALRPVMGRKEFACGLPVLRQLAAALRADPNGFVTASVRETVVSELPARKSLEIVRIEPGDTTTRAFGLAIDVGTTTCAVHLIDLTRNQVLGTASDYNGQRVRGHDIISRINYAATPERLEEMHALVLDGLNAMTSSLCRAHGVDPEEIDNAAIAGNTTMVHLMLGLNPDYIRLEPYTPTINRPPLLRGHEVGLAINPEALVVFAPGVGSYVGGDITAGLLQTPFAARGEEVSLFLDIGTNGEIVVGNGEWMMACAASAGPAFEGYGVGCGTRAMAGAVERVRIDPVTGRADVSVIGGGMPRGVCGSGMIDLLAEMWTTGLLDSSGKLRPEAAPGLVRPSADSTRNMQYLIVPAAESATGCDIVISEQDIMNLLRAKAAIYSACSLMLKSVGLDFDSVSRVYVAGGFGRFLDLRKAVVIGMLPDLPLENYVYLGNAALAGAHAILSSSEARQTILEVADRLTYLELNADPSYMDEYMAALFLPHTDEHRFPSVTRTGIR